MNKTTPRVSVIIPTYNRLPIVLRALESLREQTLPVSDYEVIVVDDGSDDDLAALTKPEFPFSLRVQRQKNAGATVARNTGAQMSQGEILVFMDDDVTAEPAALAVLAAACQREEKVLAMAALTQKCPFADSVYGQVVTAVPAPPLSDDFLHFTWANTQLLAVRRDAFFALGQLQDPTGGWPNWDDVDFGYRAHLAGFRLLRCGAARGVHWDGSLKSWQSACGRWERASQSAVRLFAVHPGLRPHIPMYHDKTPIVWGQDNPGLILRKALRTLSASAPVIGFLGWLVNLVEWSYPRPALLRPLYRWLEGAAMKKGMRVKE